MKIFTRNYLIYRIVALIGLPATVCAQLPASDTAIRSAAIANAIQQYHRFTTQPAALYNGPEYMEYFATLKEGQPFFTSVDFVKGTILYDNILYEGIPLKFDLVKNEVVTKDPSEVFRLTLFHDKISYFSIHGHTFVRILKDSSAHPLATDLYDLLYNGRSIVLLKKENKKVMTYVTPLDGVKKVIEGSSDYYVRFNNGYYRVNGKNALLGLLKDKKAPLKQYIRKGKLKFGDETIEKSMTSVVTYYDSLAK